MTRAERIISWAAERGNAEAQAEVAERKRRRATRRERSAPRLAAKAGKDAKLAAADRRVYASVAARDPGCTVQMEWLFGPCSGPLQVDHQWGRGKEPTLKTNCRRLCERHHRMKTNSAPSRADWLEDFRVFAFGQHYWGEVQKCDDVIALEKAQHPEHGRAA
jgi:hypothetical protein